MYQQVSLREVNQHLAQYIAAVEQGEEVIITRRGQPVARLLPIPKSRKLSVSQQKTWKKLLARLKKGHYLDGEKFDREKAHER